MFEPVKIAFSEELGRFYGGLSATTVPMHEFVNRGLDKSIAWCPTRMIDAAEDMLSAWRKHSNGEAVAKPIHLPVILVAMAKDTTPTDRMYTRNISQGQFVIIPDDVKERTFKLKTSSNDIRTQIAIFASDEPTARSIAAQYQLFIDDMTNRHFMAYHHFAGLDLPFGVQIETSDIPAMNIQTEAKNLTILAIDVNLRCTIPLFESPKDNEPNDGKGTDGDINDPHGYLVVSSSVPNP